MQRNRNARRMRPGFSLLELTLVLVILGILGAVAAVNVLGQSERARIQATKTSMQTIRTAIEQYMAGAGKGQPPGDLTALTTGANPLLQSTTKLEDQWGNAYFYRPESVVEGRRYTLISYGPDMESATEDDINVWTMDDED